MQKYYHHYEKSYEKFTPDWFDAENLKVINNFLNENTESLKKFIHSYLDQFELSTQIFNQKKVLIVGCGLGGLSLYFEKLGAIVTAIDVSRLAIMGAKQIAGLKNADINYQVLDICQGELDDKFDFIIDDHLYHCLTTQTDRDSYLSFVQSHLEPDGQFFMESMSYHNEIQTPVGYSFDENNILWKDIDGDEIMIRKIATSLDIEEEVKRSSLAINYLYYHSELAFDVFSDYKNYPFQFLPRTLRLIAKR